MNCVRTGQYVLITAMTITALVLNPGFCSAKQEDNDRPARSITMAAEYPGVEIPVDENVSMDIIFHNKGKTDETVDIWISETSLGRSG